jgi:hypothetical protein
LGGSLHRGGGVLPRPHSEAARRWAGAARVVRMPCVLCCAVRVQEPTAPHALAVPLKPVVGNLFCRGVRLIAMKPLTL